MRELKGKLGNIWLAVSWGGRRVNNRDWAKVERKASYWLFPLSCKKLSRFPPTVAEALSEPRNPRW